MQKFFLVFAAAAGFAAVALGAFAAHGLKNSLSPQALSLFHTGVQYQMYHALALLASTCLCAQRPPCATLRLSCAAFALGIALFSGSLYALALGAPSVLGIITPFGGAALLLGWAALTSYAYRR